VAGRGHCQRSVPDQCAEFDVAGLGGAEADRAARSLRNARGLGLDPIPNMVELLEERGVKVLTMDVEDIDGLTARVRRRGHRAAPVVVVNPTHTAERQRSLSAMSWDI